MRFSFFSLFLPLLSAALPAAAAPSPSTSEFTLSAPARVPGATLTPGSYSIHIVNRLSDRMIIAVDSSSGQLHTIFVGIPNNRIGRPTQSGLLRWGHSVNGAQYMEGWYFPGAPSVVEFVYPKADAVAIATSNPAKVPAIDPASEGKPTDNTLSKDDMQLLTLWLLSFQQVGTTGDQTSGIKAERYQQTASVAHKPVIAALPHTASLMPVLWLFGLSSMLAAALLHIVRRKNHARDTLSSPASGN